MVITWISGGSAAAGLAETYRPVTYRIMDGVVHLYMRGDEPDMHIPLTSIHHWVTVK